MSIDRTPIQIILIEQFLNTIYLIIALSLLYAYGPKLLLESGLSPKTSSYVFMSVFLILLFVWYYLWVPYTALRIWKSATIKLQGFWQYLYKTYAAVVMALIVASAVSLLIALPEIIGFIKESNPFQ